MDRLTFLMGLMVSCPNSENEDDCPFKNYRNYPIDKLISQCYQMDIQESKRMVEQHINCVQKRKKLSKAG